MNVTISDLFISILRGNESFNVHTREIDDIYCSYFNWLF